MAPAGAGSKVSGPLSTLNKPRLLKIQKFVPPPSRRAEVMWSFPASNQQRATIMQDEELAEEEDPQNSETQDEEMEDENSEDEDAEDEDAEDESIEIEDTWTEDAEDVSFAAGQSTTDKSLGAVQSSREEPAGRPLGAGSPWPNRPSRRTILQLAQCTGLDNKTNRGLLPDPTARDVIVNGLASVRFLEHVGQSPVNPDDIGVDSAGRLFKVSTSYDNNYRADFCDMVADLEKRVRHGKIEDQMKAYLSAMDACGDNEYGTDDLTGKLGCLVSDVLRNKDFSVPILERVVAECEKVVASLDETLSLFVAVKQDLLETGSTSLKRLNRLWENKWLAQTHSDLLDVNTQEDVDSLRQALTRITLCYYGPLGHAQELMRNLKLEIHEASWD